MAAKKTKKNAGSSTVNAGEVAQFDALGSRWWDEDGPMKPLHRLNPLRITYLRRMIESAFTTNPATRTPLSGLSVLDIGCGGGLVAEPLCRLGARVTGIDAGGENIKVAAAHAAAGSLSIDYRVTTAEDLAAAGNTFDIVLALEVVEHVDDVGLFVRSAAQLVRPGGLLVMSTLNRTVSSYLLGIVAAEYVLRWLPAGTHDWKKFLRPSELAQHVSAAGLDVTDICGMTYNPIDDSFALKQNDTKVNYFLTARAPA